MDLFGPYHETENRNQYALTVICMLTNYVFMIPITSKTTKEVIKAYLKDVYSIWGGSKYILRDRGGKLTSKQVTLLPKELGFIQVYTSPHTPTGNSMMEWTHIFLKASLRKPTCNHNIGWDEIEHIATMAYNVFPHSMTGEAPLYLMFGRDTFMLTLFKLLLPKARYMRNKKCKIHLDPMQEI